jgi:hypothetical protein
MPALSCHFESAIIAVIVHIMPLEALRWWVKFSMPVVFYSFWAPHFKPYRNFNVQPSTCSAYGTFAIPIS